MASLAAARLAAPPEHNLAGVVMVGLDGSPGSWAAAQYAAQDALAAGQRLRLVIVLDRVDGVPTQATRTADARRWMAAMDVRTELIRRHPSLDVRIDVRVGTAAERLASRSSEVRELVVGKDVGIGVTARTAVLMAEVPVLIVPAIWAAHDEDPRPILVGIAPDQDDAASRAALAFARERATRYDVPLRVVTSVGGGPDGTVVLLESTGAQLVVLGRSLSSSSNCRPGSVIDTVLRGAGIPVAVVPA